MRTEEVHFVQVADLTLGVRVRRTQVTVTNVTALELPAGTSLQEFFDALIKWQGHLPDLAFTGEGLWIEHGDDWVPVLEAKE